MKQRLLPLILLSLTLAFAPACAGNKRPEIPQLPVTITDSQVDQDVNAAALKGVVLLSAAGRVLNDLSILEHEAFRAGAVSLSVHEDLNRAFATAGKAGIAAVDKLESGALTTWAEVRAVVNEALDRLRPLLDALRPGSTVPSKLAAFKSVLVDLASQLVAAFLLPRLGQ